MKDLPVRSKPHRPFIILPMLLDLFYSTDPNQRFSDIKQKRESIEPIRQKWAKDRQFNNSLDEFKSKIVPISLREKKGHF